MNYKTFQMIATSMVQRHAPAYELKSFLTDLFSAYDDAAATTAEARVRHNATKAVNIISKYIEGYLQDTFDIQVSAAFKKIRTKTSTQYTTPVYHFESLNVLSFPGITIKTYDLYCEPRFMFEDITETSSFQRSRTSVTCRQCLLNALNAITEHETGKKFSQSANIA